jgi:hypothetical protein
VCHGKRESASGFFWRFQGSGKCHVAQGSTTTSATPKKPAQVKQAKLAHPRTALPSDQQQTTHTISDCDGMRSTIGPMIGVADRLAIATTAIAPSSTEAEVYGASFALLCLHFWWLTR